ncbi:MULTISPECIES: ShlB/FhaC/HecB family hemolysin secretion/activation protein [Acinetobacter]|uniref:ShlB/FhaC/HecB family hemolysin secretion/activation protein n=1 Tax=Acinetobacter TaxID=469 RepID=UPI00051B8D14|nr:MULTISPECIES: ShlB/FhaC/HecB family hemolysin secretion/activation protein [Acinetobacter]MCH7379409.1 ShlB/FhaC/HecB family hemolysin secretion/activation protein [Acinetobacter higginsii]MCJ0829035.1 ShlB/FhaC/HecB family hemolysin secretion/activation protein [Acinetobacter sp. NIPH1876]
MKFYLYKQVGMYKRILLQVMRGASILVVASTIVHADVVIPDSGTITKQLGPEQFKETPKTDQQYFGADSSQQNYSQDQTPIGVTKVQIEGNQQIATAVLHDLVKSLENKNNLLADLQLGAEKITQYYKKQGYFLAKAYLPKQKLENGILVIRVLEGQLGQVLLNNQSKIKDITIKRFTDQIPHHQALQQQQSNQTLLLISDLAGVGQIQANLQAGEQIGQTDLVLDILGQPTWLGRIGIDNSGSSYTGKYRLLSYIESNSLLGYGEKLSAQLLGSNQDLVSGSVNVRFPVTGTGLWLGGGYSRTEYELGEQFKQLDATGTSENYNVNLTYPLIRSQKTNLNLKLLAEKRKLFDEIAATNTETSKQIEASRISLNFSRMDDWGIGDVKGGINQFELITTIGNLNIQSPSALNIDRLSAKTQGSFNKYELKLSRQQRLTASSWLTSELYGQLASKNLDSAEKFSLNQMRAYPAAEGLGDQGWGASINFYYQLAPWLNTYLFQDVGRIQQNKNPYLNDKNTRNLASTGIGFGGGYQDFDYNATLAWRNTSAAKSDKDQQPRLQFGIGWRF